MDHKEFAGVQLELERRLNEPGLDTVWVETLTGNIMYLEEPRIIEGEVIDCLGGALMLSDVRRFWSSVETQI